MKGYLNSNYRLARLRLGGRPLRGNAADGERLLWAILQDSDWFGAEFRRHLQVGPLVVDFGCPARGIAIEIGDSQTGRAELVERAARRAAELDRLGYRLLRFTNLAVLLETEAVIEAIQLALAAGRRDRRPAPAAPPGEPPAADPACP